MRKGLIILFVLTANILLAQNKDTELWIDASASKKLAKKLDLGIESGFRLDSNFRKAKVWYIEPDLEYKINKYFDVGISYRFSVVPGDVNGNRVSFFGSAGYDFGKIDVSYRLKYQRDYEPGKNTDQALRNKFKIDYNLSKKVDPFAAFEFYFNPTTGQGEFEQIRIALGAEFNLPKGKDLSVYYMYRNKFNIKNPANIHVIGVGFNFGKIKNRKNKKGDDAPGAGKGK